MTHICNQLINDSGASDSTEELQSQHQWCWANACVGQKNKIRPCIIPHIKLTPNRERFDTSSESVVGMCFNNRLHARHTRGAEFSHQTHRPATIKLVRGSMGETGSFSLDSNLFFIKIWPSKAKTDKWITSRYRDSLYQRKQSWDERFTKYVRNSHNFQKWNKYSD